MGKAGHVACVVGGETRRNGAIWKTLGVNGRCMDWINVAVCIISQHADFFYAEELLDPRPK